LEAAIALPTPGNAPPLFGVVVCGCILFIRFGLMNY